MKMKRLLIFLMILCPFSASILGQEVLQFVYIVHDNVFQGRGAQTELKAIRDQVRNSGPLVIYLANSNEPFIAYLNITGHDRGAEEYAAVMSQLSMPYHMTNPSYDVERITRLFEELDVTNAFSSVSWESIITHEFYTNKYNESILGNLLFILQTSQRPHFWEMDIRCFDEDDQTYPIDNPYGRMFDFGQTIKTNFLQ